MRATDQAYLAATLDCEGSISVVRKSQGKHRPGKFSYSVTVDVYNRSAELIDWLYKNFGGFVYFRDRGGNRELICVWAVHGRAAEPALKAALPYLKVKKELAEIALALIETLSEPGTRLHRIPDGMKVERDNLVDRAKVLNLRGRQVA